MNSTDRHPAWTPGVARTVTVLGWLVAALGLLLVLLGAAEEDVVLGSVGGGLTAVGFWLVVWGRRIRRELTGRGR